MCIGKRFRQRVKSEVPLLGIRWLMMMMLLMMMMMMWMWMWMMWMTNDVMTMMMYCWMFIPSSRWCFRGHNRRRQNHGVTASTMARTTCERFWEIGHVRRSSSPRCARRKRSAGGLRLKLSMALSLLRSYQEELARF